jgi:(2R)-3-sulfolactate dehydrogenase (NADP+)
VPRILNDELVGLATRALERAGAATDMAAATARALVAADAQGLASHGTSRVPQYAAHIRHRRVDGEAIATVLQSKGAVVLVDAADGLSFPACALAVREAIARATEYGIAFAGVLNSHHFGIASYHLDPVAAVGMVGLAFSNSPAAMPAWGGKRAIFGTNPIAAVFPRPRSGPIVIDLSLSEVARGKLMVAARERREIPRGWALDRDGNPTTDPQQGLEGMMLPAGGVKGAMLALMVELLCCALTGARIGLEADSFFADHGNHARIGHAFMVIDPSALAGRDAYNERIDTLAAAMLRDADVRLPGDRRRALAEKAARDGIEIPAALLDQLRELAGQ